MKLHKQGLANGSAALPFVASKYALSDRINHYQQALKWSLNFIKTVLTLSILPLTIQSNRP
ncbi:hypothetical protein VCHA50P415_30301 [Vibrio chagasii]|nr:hypothetical protein VCHA34P121_20373 [Vibrio chagasii]CAH6892639.1 conserved hypothetical protein [Vibrio chagasii]CAH6907249.1 hypothetical protein VCHA31O71_30058 [Vibrio chagasii]CAH6932918.1 hypothetical protein VCHA36O163_40056 [Vibrio chagasii]CAH7068800.1 hypothetical protein VCHA36P166_60117 [Vibrio chagasii]